MSKKATLHNFCKRICETELDSDQGCIWGSTSEMRLNGLAFLGICKDISVDPQIVLEKFAKGFHKYL